MEDILKTQLRLTESELADYWGIKKSTLQKWRTNGVGPVYIKLGSKVVYPRESIIAYEKSRMYLSADQKVTSLDGGTDEK
jgi:predicted site-specific integrase-resolvase